MHQNGLKAVLKTINLLASNNSNDQTVFTICCDIWEMLIRDLPINHPSYQCYKDGLHELKEKLMGILSRPKEDWMIKKLCNLLYMLCCINLVNTDVIDEESQQMNGANIHHESILDMSKPFDVNLFNEVVNSAYNERSNCQSLDQRILAQFKSHPFAWTQTMYIIQQSTHTKSKMIAMEILKNCTEKWSIYDSEEKLSSSDLKQDIIQEISKVFEVCLLILNNSSEQCLIECTLDLLHKAIAIKWISGPIVFSSQLIKVLLLKYFSIPRYRVLTLKCLVEIAGIKKQQFQSMNNNDAITQCNEKLVKIFLIVLRKTFSECTLGLNLNMDIDVFINNNQCNYQFIQTYTNFLYNFLWHHHRLLEEYSNGSRDGLKVALKSLAAITNSKDPIRVSHCCDIWEILITDLLKRNPLNNNTNDSCYQLYKDALHKLKEILMRRLRVQRLTVLHEKMSKILDMLSSIDPVDTRAVIENNNHNRRSLDNEDDAEMRRMIDVDQQQQQPPLPSASQRHRAAPILPSASNEHVSSTPPTQIFGFPRHESLHHPLPPSMPSFLHYYSFIPATVPRVARYVVSPEDRLKILNAQTSGYISAQNQKRLYAQRNKYKNKRNQQSNLVPILLKQLKQYKNENNRIKFRFKKHQKDSHKLYRELYNRYVYQQGQARGLEKKYNSLKQKNYH